MRARREKAFINGFFDKDGRPALLIYYQVPEELNGDGEWVKKGSTPALVVAQSAEHRLTGSACFFVRINPKGITEKTIDQDVHVGCIKGAALASVTSLVADFFIPVLKKQEKWGRLSDELRGDLIKRVTRFGATLSEAAESLVNGVELTKPEARVLAHVHMNPQSFKDAADLPATAAECDRVLGGWLTQVRRLVVTDNVIDNVNMGTESILLVLLICCWSCLRANRVCPWPRHPAQSGGVTAAQSMLDEAPICRESGTLMQCARFLIACQVRC